MKDDGEGVVEIGSTFGVEVIIGDREVTSMLTGDTLGGRTGGGKDFG